MSAAAPITPAATVLSDAEYQARTRAVLDGIESLVDQWLDSDWIDIDTHRSGGLLELSFPDRSKIIINTQAPLQELWLAAKAGGYHYRFVAGQWLDTRDGSEFHAHLSQLASAQAGKALDFAAA
ncbi:CyaY protein [Paucibacter oligotrophus]|uniref:Iron-sulfur cluster assembly protein CyaY n=1 Tax=Roseateles oligotrophus TaxID=1769250 RepID=A0A840LFE2_9BURK|nr:iron donor protein CyaY [Roseateles oligotrophus]MBB4844759.1 CyaY protein [Roseateles oligotrophus]